MTRFSFLKYPIIVFISLLFFTSCDKDFNEVGSDIIGNGDFEFDSYKNASVTLYNQYDPVVQTNNLAVNQLGVYEDNLFGKTTASFATQLSLGTLDPEFPSTTVVDKVELTVPYFSTIVSAADNTYKLDSIYGNGKINLKIYESSKYILSLNSQTLLPQRYFSDEFSVFNSTIVGNFLNNAASPSENTEFVFNVASQEEINLNSTGVVLIKKNGADSIAKVSPRMKLQLDKTYFENMLKTGKTLGKLANNGLFKEYFRALFFKVESVGSDKSLAMLDFSKGKIRVFYKKTTNDDRRALDLNMTGNNVNLFQNEYKAGLPTSTTPVIANDNLYIKGGAGYHSYIDLFGNANTEGIVIDRSEINSLKANNWLINEANIVFTIDERTPSSEIPKRIYLYDSKNKRPIVDYFFDESASSIKPKYSKTTYGGIIFSETKNGITSRKYKFKITNHIKNIINKDSTNVRLGLSVTEDIAKSGNKYLKNSPDNAYYNSIPEASIINPLGALLWGSTSNVPYEKRVKLEIFYTKPN